MTNASNKRSARNRALVCEGNARLCQWALWRAKGVEGLSYRGYTTEAAMIEFGGDLPRGQRPASYWPKYTQHSDEQCVERWYKDLEGKDRWLLWVHYVGADGHGIRGEKRYAVVNVSKTTYYDRLAKLQERLALAMRVG